MKNLDTLDRKILYQLDCNSRLTASEIARSVRQGRDRVEYRINKLVENKVIKKFTTSVNLSSLGFTIYKMYLRIDTSNSNSKEFLKFLKTHPRVYWTAQSDGTWDLLLAIFARSAVEYYQTQQSILEKFHELIISFEVYQIVELDVFNKHYLVNSGESHVTVGGAPSNIKLDKTDISILKKLSNNSRESNTHLADSLNITPAIVSSRIDKLKKNGVITGFRIELDHRKIEMQFFKSQILLRSYDTKLLKNLREFCKKHPNITYFIQQLGACSVELEMEVDDYDHYYRVVEELRVNFGKLIKNFQTIMIRKTFFNWVPNDLS